MKRMTAFIAASCIALSACATAVQRAERTGAPDGAFESVLYTGYLELARAELDRADYTDLVTVSVLQGHENPDHPFHDVKEADVMAYHRLGLLEAANDEGQNQMVEHIELAVAAFAE